MEEKLFKIYELSKELLSDLEKDIYHQKYLKDLSKSEKTFDMGIFQGSKSKAFSIAKKLIAFGLSIEDIAQITELSSFEIKNFISYD